MPALTASLFGLSLTQALVVLFILLPFGVAAVVVPLVAWRSSGAPPPVLTSEILAHGIPAEAEILAVRTLGGLFDPRPMVRFTLLVSVDPNDPPFEMQVFQSLPRGATRGLRAGQVLEMRITPDLAAGAVVLRSQ